MSNLPFCDKENDLQNISSIIIESEKRISHYQDCIRKEKQLLKSFRQRYDVLMKRDQLDLLYEQNKEG
jgi:hypothetical protein